MDEGGVIYFIWNRVNGKRYVGQTTKPLEARMAQHMHGDIVVDKAIQKYGIENFRYGVIKTCATREELNCWEKYFIAALKSKAPYGYNMTDGGEGTVGLEFTPEHRANIAASRRGKKLSPEHRASIGAKVRGENNGFFGKHHTDKTRAIMAEIHRIETPYKNLLNELNKRNMLYTDLAVLLGIAVSTLSEKMHGNRNFTARDRERLEKIFGLPIEYILQRDDGLESTLSNRGVSVYKNLLAEMTARNMSYTALAKLIGLGVVSVSNKMHGKCHFTDKDRAKLVEIFGLPIDYLLPPEICASLSVTKKGDPLPLERRKKISESQRGEKNYNYGVPMSDKQRAQISATKRSDSPFKNLTAELDARQLSYASLAKLMGVSTSSVDFKMNDKVLFTETDAARLAKIFGKPAEYLLYRDDLGGCPELFKSPYQNSPYKNLIAELESRNMSYAALAKLMGLSESSVSMKMRVKVIFTDKDKKRLVEIFNKPIEYLLQRFE